MSSNAEERDSLESLGHVSVAAGVCPPTAHGCNAAAGELGCLQRGGGSPGLGRSMSTSPTNLWKDVPKQLTPLLACPQVAGSSWSIPALAAEPNSITRTAVFSLASSEMPVISMPERTDARRAHFVITLSCPLESSGGLRPCVTLSSGEGCDFSGDLGWCLVKVHQCCSRCC